MSDLLLPVSQRYKLIRQLTEIMTDGNSLSDDALYTIERFWVALRVLHAANAEGQLRCVQAWSTCPTCPTVVAWQSKELTEIRRAIEEEG